MGDRRVRQTNKDEDGNVAALCNRGLLWSPRPVEAVVVDLRDGVHTYYIFEDGRRADIRLTDDGRLTANGHTSSPLELADLPDGCLK